MEKIKSPRITDVLKMIETVVIKEKLDSSFHKDEVEKYFLNLLEGKDVMNVYLRRESGIKDEDWDKAVKELWVYIGIKQENHDKELF